MINRHEYNSEQCDFYKNKKQDYINLIAKNFFMERLNFDDSLSNELAKKFSNKNINND